MSLGEDTVYNSFTNYYLGFYGYPTYEIFVAVGALICAFSVHMGKASKKCFTVVAVINLVLMLFTVYNGGAGILNALIYIAYAVTVLISIQTVLPRPAVITVSVIYIAVKALFQLALPAYWLLLNIGSAEADSIVMTFGYLVITGLHTLGLPALFVWAAKSKSDEVAEVRVPRANVFKSSERAWTAGNGGTIKSTFPSGSLSVEKELELLKKRYEAGQMTEEVYKQARKNLIDKL